MIYSMSFFRYRLSLLCMMSVNELSVLCLNLNVDYTLYCWTVRSGGDVQVKIMLSSVVHVEELCMTCTLCIGK